LLDFQKVYLCLKEKYLTDLLEETGILRYKPIETPIDPNIRLEKNLGQLLDDPI